MDNVKSNNKQKERSKEMYMEYKKERKIKVMSVLSLHNPGHEDIWGFL
jgi:hypothetical protein